MMRFVKGTCVCVCVEDGLIDGSNKDLLHFKNTMNKSRIHWDMMRLQEVMNIMDSIFSKTTVLSTENGHLMLSLLV